MDFTDITHKLRYLAVNDETINSLLDGRFYTTPIPLGEADQVYPLVNIRLLASSSFRGKESYPVKSYLLDCYYISTTSIDEANAIYSRFYDIINNNRYDSQAGVMVVREDTGIMDASGIYGGQYLYILSNTWEIKAIQ